MTSKEFHDRLKKLMDEFVHEVYNVTESFPKSEIFGLTSQFRRATLSIILNYIEGYARKTPKVMRNFFEISYGSLKESKYLVFFSFKRKLLKKESYEKLINLSEEIGAMLWSTLSNMKY